MQRDRANSDTIQRVSHGRRYAILERLRAGLGAAGVTAVLVESISSRPFMGFSEKGATVAVILFAIIAFGVVSLIIDVPVARRHDADHLK